MNSKCSVCAFECGKRYSDRRIITFCTKILLNCKRLSKYKIFKKPHERGIILPKTIDTEIGYHSICYKNYSAVSKEQLKIFEDKVAATGKCKLY
jgi:hypothetical protein